MAGVGGEGISEPCKELLLHCLGCRMGEAFQASRCRQFDLQLPLLLMDSEATQRDTLAALEQHPELAVDELPPDFMQSMVPKLEAESLERGGGAGLEEVRAHRLPRLGIGTALHQCDTRSAAGQERGGGAARYARSDDCDVVLLLLGHVVLRCRSRTTLGRWRGRGNRVEHQVLYLGWIERPDQFRKMRVHESRIDSIGDEIGMLQQPLQKGSIGVHALDLQFAEGAGGSRHRIGKARRR